MSGARASLGLAARTFLLAFVLLTIPESRAEISVEYQVKAAYLSKFGSFVQWPTSAAGANARICILGKDPFGDVIDKAIAGRHVGERGLEVRRVDTVSAETVAECQILYTGNASPDHVTQVLTVTRGKPILTVADARGSDNASPVIRFVIRSNTVRFEIDERVAVENGLAISSQLLALAVAVKTAD